MGSNGTEDYTGVFLLSNGEGKSPFSSVGFLPAVNANSANKELALDFLRFMLSEEMQSSPELLFNPINRKASAGLAAEIFASVEADGFAPEGFDLEANLDLFDNMADKLGVAEYSDRAVKEFVWAELERFFAGEVSALQAAANLQTTLNTYLKE
jgi:multiple sugar transport system substrate-binding protein